MAECEPSTWRGSHLQVDDDPNGATIALLFFLVIGDERLFVEN